MGFEAVPLAGSYRKAAEEVRHRIKEQVGVPATAGIARTRTPLVAVVENDRMLGAVTLDALLDRMLPA